MINRVLIRAKVIQALYATILTQSEFTLQSLPDNPTKEKRFAYSLYMDTLAIFAKLSESIKQKGGKKTLETTAFITRLKRDDKIKAALNKLTTADSAALNVVNSLATAISESGLYRNYIKKDDSINSSMEFWRHVAKYILPVSEEFNSFISKRPDYSLRGVDRFYEMLEETFRNFMASNEGDRNFDGQLVRSLDKARELYFRLLWLPVELTNLREQQVDNARHKYIVTEEDINPNMRLIDNELVASIRNNAEVNDYISEHHIDWNSENFREMEGLLRDVMNSDIYKEYLSLSSTNAETDANFWRDIFRAVILQNPDFLEMMENKSVFWNDDLEIIGDFVIKTFRRFAQFIPGEEGSENPVLPMFKTADDARFGEELFKLTMENKELYRTWIDEALNNESWDSERLAFMDVIILSTALAEIMNFPKIPVNVSVNEYIELAKSYSSAKSGIFVNGILGAIIKKLREDGSLMK